ncbi:MAG: hypothetical protein HOH43_03515 [Candidatus Latescibacteria bacterium]|nr:hypothetical protein [Candidatus Latescibacterota bacterium]
MKKAAGLRSVCVLLVSIGMWDYAMGSSPLIWEQSTQRDFQAGDAVNVSISSSGYLSLAPVLETYFETSEPLVWCLAMDSQGVTYAGSGNDGKLYRISAKGEGSVVFDADELEIHSLAVDAFDNVYAATFPNGKIYKIAPDGSSSVFFEPSIPPASEEVEADRYIWSLAVDAAGNVFAGTGDRGRIYRIDSSGRAELLAETVEGHIVSLVLDQSGNLIAGTDPNGRVYRIFQSGRLEVLHDSPYREIRAVHVTSDGMIFAAGVNETSGRQGRVVPPASGAGPNRNGVTVQGGAAVMEVTASPTGPPGQTPAFRGGRPSGGIVYQIRPDGVVQEWWRSRVDEGFSLAANERGGLLIGTGPRGVVYEVAGRGKSTMLLRLQESQITAITPAHDGSISIASSNLGNVYRMTGKYAPEGTFDSQIKDATILSEWGQISWDAQTANGTEIQLFTRSGNTDTADNTWSEWAGPYSGKSGQPIKSPAARFIQWRAVMNTKNTETPVINRVSIAYLPKNVAPTVNAITVYEPGVFLREPSGSESVEQDLPPNVARRVSGRNGNVRSRPTATGTPTYRKGMRSVVVEATDSNDDDMRFAVYFKGENELDWKLLRETLVRPSYSWDSEAFPDGMYRLKVIASDAPDNPPSMALEAERVSDPFLVDNSSPRVADLSVSPAASSTAVVFSVEDGASPLYKVEYNIDGGIWWVIYPDDGVADSPSETFTLRLENLESGEHTIAIRAKDTSNNTGTAKELVTVP